jgi:acyl-CoA thioesterase-1
MIIVYLAFYVLSFFNLQYIDEPKTILFYGDSITAGYGLGTELAFPKLIEEKLKEAGYEVEVINGGLSGETTAGGLTRIDWMLNRSYDIFILELGGNDGLRGLPIEETRNNLNKIIERVKAKNSQTKIVVAGMMVPPNMGPDYADQFRGVFEEVADKHGALLIPFLLKDVGGIERLNQPDGIHPNVEGHQIIADNVYPIIKNLL